MRTNINEIFRVELTTHGMEIYHRMKETTVLPGLIDSKFIEAPLWVIMQIFGSSFSNVSPAPFKDNCVKNLKPGRNHVRLAATVKDIHNICNENGVPKGHIVDRVAQLSKCGNCTGCGGCKSE